MEAWAGLFADLDEKISRSKKAGAEDMPRAMAKLGASELQLLAGLAATTTSKQLAPLQLGDSAEAVRALLFAAAAAAGAGAGAASGAALGQQQQQAPPPSWSACRWGPGQARPGQASWRAALVARLRQRGLLRAGAAPSGGQRCADQPWPAGHADPGLRACPGRP
jgi:hypothetical protein